MESGHAPTADDSRTVDRDHHASGRSVSGLIDEIGDRILILDDVGTPTLELLRFRTTFTTSPGFEVALRRRVERLRHFRHPAFARTPAVEYVGQDRCLALSSNYTPGRRLSDVLPLAHDPVLAASLIHQLAPALHALNDYSEGAGHGALTASRIVCTPDGPLIMVEHVLGSAVERLHLTTAAIRRGLGIPMPGMDTDVPRADGPTDAFQLAVVAVSMLLGRPLIADEYSDLAGALKAALPSADRESVASVSGLRGWLERALQIEQGFLSSAEANAALRDVAVSDPAATERRWRALREAPGGTAADPIEVNDVLWDASPIEHGSVTPPPVEVRMDPAGVTFFEVADAAEDEPAAAPVAIPTLPETQAHTSRGYLRWALVAVALLAVVEGFVIARLLAGRGSSAAPPTVAQINLVTNDPGAPVKVDGRLAGLTPLQLSINSEMRSITVGSSMALPSTQEMVGSTGQDSNRLESRRERVGGNARPGTVPAPAAPRPGGVRVSSPIELEVFEGDTRLGSTATGIVSAPAGRHEIDLINSDLGYRSRQVVDVGAGQVVAVSVVPPNGRININAVPWAEVLVDGKLVGETPIGNLPIPLGQHEIIFRHPQLGEVRRTAVVRSDGVTRVSASLQR